MSFFERFLTAFGSTQPGYVFMWILVILSLLALILVVTRYLFMKNSSGLNTALFMNKIRGLLNDQKLEEAVRLCDLAGKRALPWIIKGAIVASKTNKHNVRRVIEERTVSVIPRLEKNLLYLATLGNISTMVGLMGTIYGLILSFAVVGSPGIDPAMKSSMLADGISAAMNTTLFGLIVSIPTILAYTSFRNKADSIITEIDLHVLSVIRILSPTENIKKSYKVSDRKTSDNIDTEPDMTPIMGLMVVLIPLLLSSAEFVKIGRTTINLPQAGASSDEQDDSKEAKEPPKTLSLGIAITEKGISLLYTLGNLEENIKKAVKKKREEKPVEKEPDIPVLEDGTQDYEKLTKELKKVKKKVLIAMLKANKKTSFNKIYKRFLERSKKEKFYNYTDHYNIKLMANNKINYQTIIKIMDATRNFRDDDGKKFTLFPVVSVGVMR